MVLAKRNNYDLTILVLPLIVLARELPALASTWTRRLWLGALLLAFLMGAASSSIAARVPLQCSALVSFALVLVLDRHLRCLEERRR